MTTATTDARAWLDPRVALAREAPPRVQIEAVDTAPTRYGFRCAGVGILLGEGQIAEVLTGARIFPVPNTPPALLGLVNLRGNLVPAFDLAVVLDPAEGASDPGRLLVIGRGDAAAAVCIDSLPRPVRIDHPLADRPPLPDALAAHASDIFLDDGRVWLAVDLDGLLGSLG